MPRLSQTDVTKAIASGRNFKLFDGNSLCLHVRNGSGIWLFHYRDGRSMRTRSLGSAADMSPSAARRAREDFAAERRRARIPRRGLAVLNSAAPAADPKSDTSKRMRFADLVDSFIELKALEWKVTSDEPHLYGLLKTGTLGKLWADEITHTDVETELRTRWGDALTNADKFRGRIERVINHGIAKEARSGDIPNPARKEIIKELIPSAPKSTPRPAMHRDGVPALMAELVADSSPAARALAFAVMTVARNAEARLADWSEIVGSDWIIPGGREERSMKEGDEHAVPLSAAALALLGPRKPSGLIFGEMHKSALNDVLASLRPNAPVTVHGMRTAFTSWAKAAGYPKDLRELAKAHAAGRTATEAAYERYDRADQLKALRPMLQAWSDYAMSAITGMRAAS